jgi:hypothetical protein
MGGFAFAAPTDDEVRGLIADLDSDRFETREQATADLIRTGRAAIDPLVEAVNGRSLEVTTRATTVLKELAESFDQETRTAAKAAIEKLAGSDNPSVASRAQAVMKPEESRGPRPFVQQRVIVGGGFQFGFGRRGMQIMQGLNGGERRTQVTEGGKTITITEHPQNGITVTIAERVKGTAQTSMAQAKDADELKEKHPEAFKDYERYAINRPFVAAGGGGLAAGVRIGGNVQPVVPGAPGANGRRPVMDPRLLERLGQSHLRLQQALQQLSRQQQGLIGGQLGQMNEEQLQKLLEQLQAAQGAGGEQEPQP